MIKEYSSYVIALDLDETLLNSDGKITERTILTLAKCKALGFVIAISSARGYGKCVKFAEAISADYICCQAGNMIVDKNKNVIYKNPFSTNEITDLIDTLGKHAKSFTVDSDFDLYGGLDDDFAHSWGIIHRPPEDLKTITSYKVCIGYEEPYKDEIINYCQNHNYVCNKMRGADLMIVTPANSNKYFALEQLMKILKTDQSKLIVFGDDTSDLLSIQHAGFGVAMSNSRQQVLDVAKYTTLSNDEDGVADFLEKNFNI